MLLFSSFFFASSDHLICAVYEGKFCESNTLLISLTALALIRFFLFTLVLLSRKKKGFSSFFYFLPLSNSVAVRVHLLTAATLCPWTEACERRLYCSFFFCRFIVWRKEATYLLYQLVFAVCPSSLKKIKLHSSWTEQAVQLSFFCFLTFEAHFLDCLVSVVVAATLSWLFHAWWPTWLSAAATVWSLESLV